MSKRDSALYLLDILIAYNKILRYTKDFTNADDFLHSELEWDATIRELEIIGEATNNLLKENIIEDQYRRIVDFRNQIAHGYFGIDAEIVLDVIQNKLNIFTDELKNINIDLTNAIEKSKHEHKHNQHILKLLNSLEERE